MATLDMLFRSCAFATSERRKKEEKKKKNLAVLQKPLGSTPKTSKDAVSCFVVICKVRPRRAHHVQGAARHTRDQCVTFDAKNRVSESGDKNQSGGPTLDDDDGGVLSAMLGVLRRRRRKKAPGVLLCGSSLETFSLRIASRRSRRIFGIRSSAYSTRAAKWATASIDLGEFRIEV